MRLLELSQNEFPLTEWHGAIDAEVRNAFAIKHGVNQVEGPFPERENDANAFSNLFVINVGAKHIPFAFTPVAVEVLAQSKQL